MSVPRTRTASILAAVAVLSLVMSLSSPASAGQVVLIRGNNAHWHPARVEITTGTVVRWKAIDVRHHLVSYGGNWSVDSVLNAGDSVRHRFRRTGTFKFYCSIHGSLDYNTGACTGMCGRVRVTSG